ncbi:MAG: phosphate ABC transporter substrate-binding protein, partial [Candidatus Thermoplasmatota archaeon]|nr:phosphate ABC transporter substrate-binding protein [Candidatus Thermoplasmatota archaeon]
MLKNKIGLDRKGVGMLVPIVIIGLIVVGTIGAGLMMGWFDGAETEKQPETINIVGSTTVLPIAATAAEEFMAENDWATINVAGGGSSVGVRGAAEGTADIGMSSRELKSSEITENPTLVKHTVAKDGLAVIVNPSNLIAQLTIQQVKGIYNGTYTNWNQLGGSSATIVVIGRDSASGTRGSFDEMVMDGEGVVATMEQASSNGEIHDTISANPAAIGYVGLGYLSNSVKGLKISNGGEYALPAVATVLDGSYPIARNLYFLTNGQPTGLAKDFIDYVMSPAGQNLVEVEGFVPVAATVAPPPGSISVVGSTTVLPVVAAAAEE